MKQFVSVNGYKSNLADVKCGVPQGSILRPLLFLIYINDLHVEIKYSEVHHFADDTNVLNFNSCVKSSNKQVNYDLKILSNWLKQFVSINGYKSNLADVKCGVPQGSILRPLLFLIYINDLHVEIKYSEVHHFADDTNVLNFNSCVKSSNKQVNYDLKTYQIG